MNKSLINAYKQVLTDVGISLELKQLLQERLKALEPLTLKEAVMQEILNTFDNDVELSRLSDLNILLQHYKTEFYGVGIYCFFHKDSIWWVSNDEIYQYYTDGFELERNRWERKSQSLAKNIQIAFRYADDSEY